MSTSTTETAACTECPENSDAQATDLAQQWARWHRDKTGHTTTYTKTTVETTTYRGSVTL